MSDQWLVTPIGGGISLEPYVGQPYSPPTALYEGELEYDEDGNLDMYRMEDPPYIRPYTEAERTQQQRDGLSADIDAQVPDSTVQRLTTDPAVQSDIIRYASAAEDKQRDLQDTPDNALDAFDSTLAPVPPQNGVAYSRLEVDIRELEPWVGAPNAIYGVEATLEVQSGLEDQGAEARIYIVDAPAGAGSVLPFVQDPVNPDGTESKLWRVESGDGYKWADSSLPASVQLLWGAGSLPVSRTITIPSLHNRRGTAVRYGVASGASARGRRR